MKEINPINKPLIRYRSVGELKNSWRTANSLDEILNYDHYIVEITHGDDSVSLPIPDCGREHYIVAHLFVTDCGTAGAIQTNRISGQILLLSNCHDNQTKIYTRTHNADNTPAWSGWTPFLNRVATDKIEDSDDLSAVVESLAEELRNEIARIQNEGKANSQAIAAEAERALISETAVIGKISNLELRNGSVGNSGNAYCVAQKNIYPLEFAKNIMFYTNRPNSNNCVYRFVYGLYNVNTGLVGSVPMLSGFDNYNNIESEALNYLEITDPHALGVAFGLTEWDTITNKIVPLRIADFNGYSAYIIEVNNKSLLYRYITSMQKKTVMFDYYSPSIGNGTFANSGNKFGIRNATAIPIKKGDIVTVELNKNLNEGHYLTFGFAGCKTSATSDIGGNRTEGHYYDTFPECKSNSYIVTSEETKFICVNVAEYDSNNSLMSLRASDFISGDLIVKIISVNSHINSIVNSLISQNKNNINFVLERNKEREQYLVQSSHYNKIKQGVKDFQFCLVADSHQDTLSESNSISVTNSFKTIDALIHCGDILDSYYVNTAASSFIKSMKQCEKPFYIILGNHDLGNGNYIGKCCDHQQAYDTYIKPMSELGFISDNESVAGNNYWFHDFSDYKIRLIGLYEFDNPLELDETYWRAIPYDSSLPNMELNTFYAAGSKINVRNYNGLIYSDYSFEAVKDLTTPSNLYQGNKSSMWPGYKTVRGFRLMRKEQAQWFLDTLASTPKNYSVIVALHNPFSDLAETQPNYKFSQSSAKMLGADVSQNYIATDFIANAVYAFNNGENYSEKVVMKGDAEYLNTLSDVNGNPYYYEVMKDFRTKNSGAKFAFFVGGHAHRDLIWKHPKYNLYQISVICATTSIANCLSNDVCRSNDDGLTKDCLTIVSVDTTNNSVGLVKIGCNVTMNAEKRDFEIINFD